MGTRGGKRPLGTPRRRWEDNIKMDLQEVGLGGGGKVWYEQAQDRDRWRALMNAVLISVTREIILVISQLFCSSENNY